MKGLTLFRRTIKSEGMIKLRFRLKDGVRWTYITRVKPRLILKT